jgi:hypothetical protein
MKYFAHNHNGIPLQEPTTYEAAKAELAEYQAVTGNGGDIDFVCETDADRAEIARIEAEVEAAYYEVNKELFEKGILKR